MSNHKQSEKVAFLDYLNPNYGHGIFRRHVLIEYGQQQIQAKLEDDVHGFSLKITHDNQLIKKVEATALRYPFDTCASADEPLKAFEEQPLSLQPQDAYQRIQPLKNCTHLYDLMLAVLFHYNHAPDASTAHKRAFSILYEISVHDEYQEQAGLATIDINKERIHAWKIKGWTLLKPEPLKQKPLLKGFSAWANQEFNGLSKQAAFMLQKGIFVAQARRYSIDKLIGKRASEERSAQNVCHTYSPENAQRAIRLNNPTKDFTHATHELLTFTKG